MKYSLSMLLVTVFLVLTGCSGGGSTDGAGGGVTEGSSTKGETTTPVNIAGSYNASWQGGGTNKSGAFTCLGTLKMNISQSGGTLAVTSNVKKEEGDCEDDFDFLAGAGGSYNSNTGAISITSAQGSNTLSLNGIATEQDGKIGISGPWSVINTASADVVSAGTWSAESD